MPALKIKAPSIPRLLCCATAALVATTVCTSVPTRAAADEVPATARAGDGNTPAAGAAPRYTFSWPLDGTTLEPRGGTTRGAPVELDRTPSSAWRALQAPELTAFERDRRAILAMAGTYRVTFDFLEVTPFDPDAQPQAPYQSWGTEKIYVDQDEGRSISLVHILEMRMREADGSLGEPIVTKHWRQDWSYEPTQIVEYRGRDHWARRALDASQTRGAWRQTVYQVDESPRYAALGRWQHTPSFSTWLSAQTWRPLPRREWSVRDDYQVLIGTNRHTIEPAGWVQEENNLKGVLDETRALAAGRPYLAREYGVARYERLRAADFREADLYYARTREFWNDVRAAWADVFARQGEVTLRGPVDKLGLFRPLFEHAGALAAQASAGDHEERNQQVIRDALEAMGVPMGMP